MATTPQPHFTALTIGNGLQTCGFEVEMKDRFGYWTTFDGVNRDTVAGIIANPAGLAASIANSLEKAMKIFWQMSAIKFTCTAASTEPDFSGASSLTGVIFEGILPPTRVCSPDELRYGLDRNPENEPRYAVSSSYRGMIFVKYLYDGEFIGWGTHDGRSPTSFLSFLAIESAAGGVWSRLNICGYINQRANTSRRTYEYAYVEIGGISFVCEAFVETTSNNPPTRVVTTTLDATNMKAEATLVYSDGSGSSYTNTCLCKIDGAAGFEYFSFVT